MSDQLHMRSEYENDDGLEESEIMVNDGASSQKSLSPLIVTVCFECRYGKYAHHKNSTDRCRGKIDSRFPRNKGHSACNWDDDVRLDCRGGNRQQQTLTTSCMQKEVEIRSKNSVGSLNFEEANEKNFKLLEQCEISDHFFSCKTHTTSPPVDSDIICFVQTLSSTATHAHLTRLFRFKHKRECVQTLPDLQGS